MAKKLEQDTNAANGEPVQVSTRHNLEGLDPDQLVSDVREIISLQEELKEAGEPIKDQKKSLKSERGYHMGGFQVCMKLERMDPVERRDWWLTVRTYAERIGLNDPDLVDQMGEAVGNA